MRRDKITETELCAGFIAIAKDCGWTAYPELEDFDIVLVRDDLQIGIQAKLRFNATLLRQIIPVDYYATGCPQYLGILLPVVDRDVAEICEFMGFLWFAASSSGRTRHFLEASPFEPRTWHSRKWDSIPVWSNDLIELPDYVPDVAAGASAPVRLTPWKIGALKVCATIEIRGHVDKLDFKRYGIDRRRWIAARWVVPMPVTTPRSRLDSTIANGKALRYVYGPKPPVFPKQHPVVYEQIKAEVSAWLEEFENQA